MKNMLVVFIGGGIGTVLRYAISLLIPNSASAFPWPTLLVNLLGCFAMGLLMGYYFRTAEFSNSLRLLLMTGFCGGFTTFSAFSKETIELFQGSQYSSALIYLAVSVLGCLLVTWSGFLCMKA
jgi:fluoride exporter